MVYFKTMPAEPHARTRPDGLKALLERGLAGRLPKEPEPDFTRAAVLVPVIDGHTPRLLFMERAPHPRDPHSGQISFPGGRWEPCDADAYATALRETHEELGVAQDTVEVLGPLEETLTPTGYSITPIVGWLKRPPVLKPDAREVASCFEVPLEELADPKRRFTRGEHRIAGRDFEVFEYRAGERVIWGATARIIASLLELAVLPSCL